MKGKPEVIVELLPAEIDCVIGGVSLGGLPGRQDDPVVFVQRLLEQELFNSGELVLPR